MLWDALMPESLQWEVATRPVYRHDGSEIPGKMEVYRTDTNRHFNIVSTDYTPLQNSSCVEFLNSIDGTVEKAGVFGDGCKVWWVVKLPGTLYIAGETLDKYSVMVNAHDGSLGFRWFVTPIRPRCHNMMNVLIKHAIDFNISARHTLNIAARVDTARSIFGRVTDVYTEMEVAFTIMAHCAFDLSDLRQYVASVLNPVDPNGTRFMNAYHTIKYNFVQDAVVNQWGAMNAVTKYLEHQRPLRGASQHERRFAHSIFGATAAMKQRAYDMLQENNDGRPNYTDYTGHRVKRDTGVASFTSGNGPQSTGMDDIEGS